MRALGLIVAAAVSSALSACAPDAPASSEPPDTADPKACAPQGGDTDGDGICDAFDNCVAVKNAGQEDADADGRGDACDVVDGSQACAGLGGDEDQDDLCAAFDNCPDVANRDQRDVDFDRVGDACDPTDDRDPCTGQGHDNDSDGVCSAFDNCANAPNPDQDDIDGDGLGDACDPFDGTDACAGRGHDDDGDGVCSAFDNCADNDNADQRDVDGDGLGDACDPTPEPCDGQGGDDDLDTVCSDLDNCPEHPNIAQRDADFDGIGDLCDPTPTPATSACDGLGGDGDGDNYCGLYDNCPLEANPSQHDADGDGIGDACDFEECDRRDNDGDGEIDEDQPDADGDGVPDCQDECPDAPDADSDGDGIVDCIDACPNDPLNDSDRDRICGDTDNCPTVANYSLHGQRDDDGDGIGNACDVEECDGINNDGDLAVDESMQDEDGDGLCDAIDPCLADPLNDPDGDGVCGAMDNCAETANAAQEDTDGDGSGDACDLDFPSGCDAPAPLAAPGSVPLPATLLINDVAARVASDVVFVSVATEDASYPNSVVAVHAPTNSVLWSTFVGSQPAALALSDDGSLLYVALDGAAAIRAVDVEERRACRSFAVGQAGDGAPLFGGDLAAFPGAPNTLVVSTRRKGFYADFGGVFVYDSGFRRPLGTQGYTGARLIEVASDGRVFGYSNRAGQYFRELRLTAAGIEEVSVQRDLITGSNVDIHYASGRVYATSGVIIDVTATPQLTGTLSGTGPIAVEPTTSEAFMLVNNNTISVFDTTTFVAQRTIALSSPFYGARKLLRWGSAGLVVANMQGVRFIANAVSVP